VRGLKFEAFRIARIGHPVAAGTREAVMADRSRTGLQRHVVIINDPVPSTMTRSAREEPAP
jgi:hypothetical protein